METKKLDDRELALLRGVDIKMILGITYYRPKTMIRCPFPNHTDGTPSCLIDAENGYHCFGCGKHGNGAISFLMDMGSSFEGALEEIIKYL